MAAPILAAYRHQYAALADFAYVYVEEAHAADEWPLGDVESFAQPRTMDERRALARRFAEEYAAPAGALFGDEPIPVYVDSLGNEFNQRYAVWPERLFVLEGARLGYISSPCNEYGFDRRDIGNYLCAHAALVGRHEVAGARRDRAQAVAEAEAAEGTKRRALPSTGSEEAQREEAAADAWSEPEQA